MLFKFNKKKNILWVSIGLKSAVIWHLIVHAHFLHLDSLFENEIIIVLIVLIRKQQ